MRTRFLVANIKINSNKKYDLVYIPQSGIIINNFDSEIIYEFEELEMSNFFYFRIEFDKYKYDKYYQPTTQSYTNKLSKRIYNLFLYLNLDVIYQNRDNKTLCRKLTYYFSILQIEDIQKKKIYNIGEKKLNYFFDYRNLNNMYIIPWYYFRINNDLVFDLKQKKLISSDETKRNQFKRKGGIIETNNVRKLINNIFVPNDKILVIIPNNMTDLWTNTHKITYNELLLLNELDIKKLQNKKFKQIVIHECHIIFLTDIKKLVNRLECNNIWIINSLPLKYYFENNSNKLTINELFTITNLWSNFTLSEKKKYKTELIRLLFTKLNQYYAIINYKMDYSCINTIKLPLMPLEMNIYREFMKYYNNWRNNLTNDPDNHYSFTTIKKNNKIETKIYNAVITLILSIVEKNNIPNFFESNTKIILKKTIDLNKNLDQMLNKYYFLNKMSYHKIMNNEIIDFNDILSNLQDKKKITEIKINNYQRYLEGTVYTAFEDNLCPICYSSDNITMTKLICGHTICLECIFGTIKKSNKCPICGEFINIHKIAIIKETTPNYVSNIVKYLKKLTKTSIILTDLYMIDNLLTNLKYNTNIINITKPTTLNKINKIKKIENIIILTTPKKIMPNEIDKIINYYSLLNNNPIINKINFLIE